MDNDGAITSNFYTTGLVGGSPISTVKETTVSPLVHNVMVKMIVQINTMKNIVDWTKDTEEEVIKATKSNEAHLYEEVSSSMNVIFINDHRIYLIMGRLIIPFYLLHEKLGRCKV